MSVEFADLESCEVVQRPRDGMIDVMFIAIGVIGVVLLLSSLLFDDVLDELVPDLDFLSGPVIGSFLAAFGLFGWFADSGIGAPTLLAILVAVGGGLALGGATYKATDALMNQPTDATPTTASLIGATGKVVTPVRANGIGEVLVLLGGASTKYTVTADVDLALGTPIVVIAVETPTKLRVQSESEFWA